MVATTFRTGTTSWFARHALGLLAGVIAVATTVQAAEPPTGPEKEFDDRIAPLLARSCLSCHGAASKKGGLDLSRVETTQQGGKSGPVIVAGKPEASYLWERVDADEMPPEKPLSSADKQILKSWMAAGAKWGTSPIDPFLRTTDVRAGYDWWSLRPVQRPELPQVRDAAWPRNQIDRFVLSKLERVGLAPAGQADSRTLIRRLYFDLIGLPPSPEEMNRWIDSLDERGDPAYRELVDHLLESPHYGERWARHWLDVVRFGETQGYERNRIRENAWRYRDWVINAFNQNLPFDEFVRLQIAGDLLQPGDYDALMATGYHVCGTWDQVAHVEGSALMREAARHDAIEDLVATLGQSFIGLTINCARCHDHKFDPISQREYYQIAALLGGVTQQTEERQNITASRDPVRERELRDQLPEWRGQLADLEQGLREKYGDDASGRPVEGLQVLYRFDDPPGERLPDRSQVGTPIPLRATGAIPFASDEPPARLIHEVKSSGEFTVEAWITPDEVQQSGPARIVTLSVDSGRRNFTLGHDGDRFDVRLRTTKTDDNGIPSLASPDGSVTKRKSHVVYTFDRKGAGRIYVNGQRVAEQKIGGDLSNWDDGFRLGLGDEFSGGRRWKGQFHFVAVYSRALNGEQVRHHFETESQDIRAIEPLDEVLARASEPERSRYKEVRERVARTEAELDRVSFSGTAHVIIPEQPPVFHVLARGEFRNPLEAVSPVGLKALAPGGLSEDFGLKPDAPEAQRRLHLAEWLADRRNPLTARVFVNRVWQSHFGRGIVDTPSDFGFNGGRPSHPELLDWLAWEFMEDGWKVKDLHRLIVTSAAYRQESQVRNERAESIDAENRLLWRFDTQRLEGEAVRDAALAVSGALNRTIGGPSYRDVKVNGGVMGTNAEFTEPTGEFSDAVNRRTIYRLWARSGNNPMLTALDCPDPSVMAPTRTQTITPVQAASLLNGSFMENFASRLAQRAAREAGDDVSSRIDRAYRLALSRPPNEREAMLARTFVDRHGLGQFCLVLLNANEFLFVN